MDTHLPRTTFQKELNCCRGVVVCLCSHCKSLCAVKLAYRLVNMLSSAQTYESTDHTCTLRAGTYCCQAPTSDKEKHEA